jgi:hypothetical protein
MRVAQDQMVDGSETRADGAKVSHHTIVRASREIVVASCIVQQIEIWSLNKDG